jgi:hypothetical protein
VSYHNRNIPWLALRWALWQFPSFAIPKKNLLKARVGNLHLQSAYRLLIFRAFWLVLGPPRLLGSGELTLSWNHWIDSDFRCYEVPM